MKDNMLLLGHGLDEEECAVKLFPRSMAAEGCCSGAALKTGGRGKSVVVGPSSTLRLCRTGALRRIPHEYTAK